MGMMYQGWYFWIFVCQSLCFFLQDLLVEQQVALLVVTQLPCVCVDPDVLLAEASKYLVIQFELRGPLALLSQSSAACVSNTTKFYISQTLHL